MNIENTITNHTEATELPSQRIKLRHFTLNDVADVFEYASDDRVI